MTESPPGTGSTEDRRVGVAPARPARRSVAARAAFGRDGRGWAPLALAAGVAVACSYLLTHPYPAYGAGLYLEIADQIRAHGYALPATVPYYAGGVPLAYPPLQFYVVAVLRDAGLSGLAISRFVPALVTVLYLVPYYGIAGHLLPTRRQAGLATLLLALSPPALQWHLSAGGIVRASAFLLALCGVYAGCRVFVAGDRRWVPLGSLLFGLTVLSHPVYAVYTGLSWLVLYAGFDRTTRGLVRGAVVAGGGLVLAAPWVVTVVSRYGPSVLTGAAGSHSGLGGGAGRLLDQFVYPLDPNPVSLLFVGVFAAALVSLARRRYVLPAWLVVGAYVLGKERFQFVPGAMLLATVLLGVVVPRLHAAQSRLDRRQVATAVLAAVVVTAGVGGTLYAASALATAHHGSPSLPPFVDADDRAAMAWAAAETDPDASFVVLGDAAEWFPHYAARPLPVGPWGVEWKSPRRYYAQLETYRSLSACGSAACVDAALASAGVSPDYLYVPNEAYTVRGLAAPDPAGLRRSLAASDRYDPVYRNGGVTVYRVGGERPARPGRGAATAVAPPLAGR